jgi:glutamine transport system ATP-binding protein
MSEGQAAGTGHLVELERVRKSFGDNLVLDGIDLTIDRGEVVVIAGPSGSGKSTMLRCINGLEGIDDGDVRFDGKSLARAGKEVNRMRAEIGMVFQQFNLFAHKTVMENLTMAPVEVKGLKRQAARDRANRLLERVGMTEKADAFPADLSGGQQQRVAIARALAMRPKVMLFDEVTSALDPELVGEVLAVIRRLAYEGMTMIIVTHEIHFARDVAEDVIFMDGGMIVEQGRPDRVLDAPSSERLKQFLRRYQGSYHAV